MIRRGYFFLLLIGIGYQKNLAQLDSVQRWHVSAGITLPSSPDQFYDYWKQGFQIMGGVELPGQSRYIQYITAEVNYFAFDQQRFLQRIGLANSNIPTSGAATFSFAFAYLVRYTFIEYQTFRPTFFAGIGCEDIYRSSATIDYPNYTVSQEGQNSITATIPFGAAIMLFERKDKAIEVNFTYSLGFPKKENINSSFSCFKIDYLFSQ